MSRIVPLFPDHDSFFSSCLGGASEFAWKVPAKNEIGCDVDHRITNFFEALRDQSEELLRLINLTPWSEEEYLICLDPGWSPLEDARRFFAACWMSVTGGSNFDPRGFRWLKNVDGRWNSPVMDMVDRDDLLWWAARLTRVQFLNRDALDVLPLMVKENCLIYHDPPYVQSTRQRHQGYTSEVTEQWHIDAAALLRQAVGPVVVSGYASTLYREEFEDHGWVRVDWSERTNSGGTAVESIWLNERAQRAGRQRRLL